MGDVLDSPSVVMNVPKRYRQMERWLHQVVQGGYTIEPLVNDASFRCYYRLRMQQGTLIVMDAPPQKESVDAFIAVAKAFLAGGICVPVIIAENIVEGFLLLSDLGSDLYFKHLNSDSADRLYNSAFNCILKIQSLSSVTGYSLPAFTAERLSEELGWFNEWYLNRYCGVVLSVADSEKLQAACNQIISEALTQPTVLVHKDFHSRNLFVLSSDRVGVIDFQDALEGPLAYDLMSLLYDHYIAWPREKIKQWVHVYYIKMQSARAHQGVTFEQFLRWHDVLMLQRVMKNLGNFARLHLVRGKSGYLADMPRIYRYLLEVTGEYADYRALHGLLLRCQPKECV